MSTKRQATTDLNHENWDQEDPEEKDESGGFKMAQKEVLEKRVMRTAKRRSQVTGEEKSVFSGFTGFNKIQKSSMEFLANLTNGSKPNNGLSTTVSDTASISSNSLITKPAEGQSGGIFTLSGTSTPITKSAFGQPSSESAIFGKTGTSPTFMQSVFSSSKPDSTVNDNPFKAQSSINSKPNVNFTVQSNTNTDKPVARVSSTLFGVNSASASNNSSPFSTKTNSPTPLKTPVTSRSPQTNTDLNKSASNSEIKDDKKLTYYSNLKGLNESVTAWIKKHVEETPLCILTPIFRDYEKHLKGIQDEYDKSKEQSSSQKISDTKNTLETKSTALFSGNNISSTVYPSSTTSTNSVFSSTSSIPSSKVEKTNFSFGINTPTTSSTNNFSATPIPTTGFSFGIKPSNVKVSPFAATNTSVTAANSSSPFSFGIGKPFTFNSNIKSNDEPANEGEDNAEEPPQVEYTPIAEENSVYDIKCKVFVKKDANFIEKGVGTLYIKKIEESGKHQLLVRANTSLGNVLINMILSASIPIQRMGKNNVMMICIPTPDAKPPPASMLIRVKTSEDADKLLETLNKFKG